jgi:PhnB protein
VAPPAASACSRDAAGQSLPDRQGRREAIAFYQKAFGAVEQARLPAQDGKRLMHACLSINGGTVMLSDEFPE